MRSHHQAYIGFVREGAPDYDLLRRLGRTSLIVLVMTDRATPATRRALEQLRLGKCDLELIDQAGVAPLTFEELVGIARRDLGAGSVLPLTPQDALPRSAEPSAPTSGLQARIEVVNVGSPTHRSIHLARLDAATAAQFFFPLDVFPTTTRIQIEIHAPWPALVTFDGVALLDATQAIDIDPMEFEHDIAHYNAMPLGLDDRGFTLLCTCGTMVLQVLGPLLARLPRARLLEMRLRCKPLGAPLGDDGGLRAIGHPEDRLISAAAHLAARTRRLEAART